MKNRIVAVTLVTLLLAIAASAQEKKDESPRNVYKLDFTVAELENGKRINERSYTMHLLDDRRGAKTKVGTRVPVLTGDKQWQYIDVGIRIDADIQAADESGLILGVAFDSSSYALPEQSQMTQPGQPLLRTLIQSVIARVPFGKPTLVCSADDVNSKRRVIVELTATRVK